MKEIKNQKVNLYAVFLYHQVTIIIGTTKFMKAQFVQVKSRVMALLRIGNLGFIAVSMLKEVLVCNPNFPSCAIAKPHNCLHPCHMPMKQCTNYENVSPHRTATWP